jgi:cytochrome P450
MLQSVKHALVNCLLVLLARPDDWRRMRLQPMLVPQAIEECLRFDGPSQAVGRVATAALCIAGQKIASGAFVRLAVASANRDAARFVDPDRFDLDRTCLPHLGFGHAFHSCPGAHLARLILQRGISSVAQTFVAPTIDTAGVVRDPESSLRGYLHAPVFVCG